MVSLIIKPYFERAYFFSADQYFFSEFRFYMHDNLILKIRFDPLNRSHTDDGLPVCSKKQIGV